MMMLLDVMYDGYLKYKLEEGGMVFLKGYFGVKDGWFGESCVLMFMVVVRLVLIGCVC